MSNKKVAVHMQRVTLTKGGKQLGDGAGEIGDHEIKAYISNLVRTTFFWNNLLPVRSKSKGLKTK